MKRLLLTTAMLGALIAPALATIHDLSFSGVFNNGEAYSGSLSLDVVGNEIESGTGTLTTPRAAQRAHGDVHLDHRGLATRWHRLSWQ